jgi:hypothetical protein
MRHHSLTFPQNVPDHCPAFDEGIRDNSSPVMLRVGSFTAASRSAASLSQTLSNAFSERRRIHFSWLRFDSESPSYPESSWLTTKSGVFTPSAGGRTKILNKGMKQAEIALQRFIF